MKKEKDGMETKAIGPALVFLIRNRSGTYKLR